MEGYLRRLAASGLAYQASSLLAALLALFTLPLYTRHLSQADFGYAETLLTLVILTSILLRAGMGEAFIRHWYDTPDDTQRRRLPATRARAACTRAMRDCPASATRAGRRPAT